MWLIKNPWRLTRFLVRDCNLLGCPPLGVGLVYFQELDPLFREEDSQAHVLELEPQVFWTIKKSNDGQSELRGNVARLAQIRSAPQRKLIHSVGAPVGGMGRPNDDHFRLLAEWAHALDAHWVSDHLSFNSVRCGDEIKHTGFFLPPRQTAAGVRLAARNIRHLRDAVRRPVAFETGVNYLQPRSDEMSDGAFFAAVAEEADCGIVLDLHNLWANERNGRARVCDVVDALPLERVWEIHLAGGKLLDGYYLDAHSGLIPEPVLELAADVVSRTPNLGAIIFEILPNFVADIGLARIRRQLSAMNDVWRLRPMRTAMIPRLPTQQKEGRPQADAEDLKRWELALSAAALNHGTRLREDEPACDVLHDPGLEIYRKLIADFRDSQITRIMRHTITLLLAHLGATRVRELLSSYRNETFPDAYPSIEADQFARFLFDRLDSLGETPYLADVLGFEHAVVRAALYGQSSHIEWKVDPAQLFDSLSAGRMPAPAPISPTIMEIRGET